MKRQGFILTEILTGMVLQVGFAIVLCSAFYMILNFSTNTQQGFTANDKGQMVISYFDSRIRNAGLGLWKCNSSQDIRIALQKIHALNNDSANKILCLPVAIVQSADGKVNVSHDKTGRFYSGNVLTLLYAHKDTKEYQNNPVRLILITDKKQTPVTLVDMDTSASNDFIIIDNNKNNIQSYLNSSLGKNTDENTNRKSSSNIKRYTVMENVGVPVYTADNSENKISLRAFTGTNQPTIYPMTEMLNLECQKLYTVKDDNGYNFKFRELTGYGYWGSSYYHTKDILELYMTLDTRPNTPDRVPIFELRVLVSEGINELGTTAKPKDWPGRWTADFNTHKVHVSKAAWKLYNLAPFFH